MQGIDLSTLRAKPEENFSCLSDEFKGAIEEAIQLHGFGDKVQYDWGLTAAPAPNGQLMPVYILTLTMPTLVLGEVAQSMGMLAASGLTVDGLKEIVKESIENMRKARDEQSSGLDLP